MIRARFHANANDPRPINWPLKHPYWVTGYGEWAGEGYATIVAYADDEAEILANWPEAADSDIESIPVDGYTFTDRFPKPDWFKG